MNILSVRRKLDTQVCFKYSLVLEETRIHIMRGEEMYLYLTLKYVQDRDSTEQRSESVTGYLDTECEHVRVLCYQQPPGADQGVQVPAAVCQSVHN